MSSAPDLETKLARRSFSPRKLLATMLPAGATVLDVGCGDFHKTYNYLYQTNPSLRIVGVDLEDQTHHPPDIPKHIERTGHFGRLACDVDSEALPFDEGSFSAVYCSHLIEHVKRQEHVLAEIFRVIAPDGLLYLETPGPRSLLVKPGSWMSKIATVNPPNHWDDPTHVAPPWNLDELSVRLEGAGFRVLRRGYHREFGTLAIPFYAAAFAAGLLPVWPRDTRSVLVGAGWWNLVGWPIWALARKPQR